MGNEKGGEAAVAARLGFGHEGRTGFCATGAEVWASRPGMQGIGRHVLRVGTEALPAGIYVVKFELGGELAMRKVGVLE